MGFKQFISKFNWIHPDQESTEYIIGKMENKLIQWFTQTEHCQIAL